MEVNHVFYGFHAQDLFGDWEDADAYDPVASAERYSGMVQTALKLTWTGAQVEVEYDLDATGELPSPLQCRVNGAPTSVADPDELVTIFTAQDVAQKIYQNCDWQVPKTIEPLQYGYRDELETSDAE